MMILWNMRTTDEGLWGDEIQSRPGNSGFPESISASTHPTLQTSIARVYSLNVNMTSGARYHLHSRQQARRQQGTQTYLVATYSVMNVLLSFATLGGGLADLASPKSQSWTFTGDTDETKSIGGTETAAGVHPP